MTETSILPGTAPVGGAGEPVAPGPADFDESGDGSRRRLMIIGGVIGLVVILAAAYMLLHKGGSSGSDTFRPQAPAARQAAGAGSSAATKSSGAAKGHAAAGATLPKKSHTSLVRDPFNPLVVAPSTSSSTTSGAPVSTTTVPQQTTTGTSPISPVVIPTTPAQGGQPTTPSSTGSNTTGSPLWVQLIRTDGEHSATFDVGYAHHKFRRFTVIAPSPTSSRGTIFDKIFALLGIQNGQVTLQIGDNTPFDLTKGVAHSV